MRAPRPARAGFTLIELLVVMTIIAILAAVTLPLVTGALNSQRKAKATGEIAALMGACERYRVLYGDFPCARNGTGTTVTTDQPNYRRDLFLQLSGRQRLASTQLTGGGVGLSLISITQSSTNIGSRPLINPGIVTAGLSTSGGDTPANLATCDEFIDPWGNAYDYRYRILSAPTVATSATPALGNYGYWFSPDCFIVSCGAKFVAGTVATTGFTHVPLPGEYWNLDTNFDMTRRGVIPVNGSASSPDGYFGDSTSATTGVGQRADNITNFSGR